MCLLCDFGDDGLCDDCLRARPHDPTHILRKHYTKRMEEEEKPRSGSPDMFLWKAAIETRSLGIFGIISRATI